MNTTSLYPAWKQARKELKDKGLLAPGTIIPKEVLLDMLGINEATTINQFQRNQLDFLREFDALRTSLLEDECVMLRAIPGIGYEVIPPEAQTDRAVQDRMYRVKKEVRKMCMELKHVQHDKLSNQQRAENANAIAKAGQFALMVRRNTLPKLG